MRSHIHKILSALVMTGMFLTAVRASDVPAALAQDACILFQGDSITDGNRGRNADPNHILGHGYAFIIAADLGGHFPERNLTFLNRGVSGNKVSDLAARWQKDTLELKPDVLSILIGVNDVGMAMRNTNGVATELFERDYDRILSEARAANPELKIVLCEPFILPGKSNTNHWDEWWAGIKSLQAVVEKLAAKYHAPVVHFQKIFDDAAKRAPVDYWIWDGIHPTYRGHQLMADEWLRVVRETWPESATNHSTSIFRYTNPITHDPAMAMRDHFILKVGKQWFMTGTSMPVWSGPNPGVRLLVSDDLLNWRHAKWLIDASKLPDDCPYKGRFWASEIHRAQGKFWLTVNSGHRGTNTADRLMDEHNIWLFVADKIDGDYKLVNGPLSTGFKNDSDIFTDDDGQSYLYCSGGGLWQAKIDLAKGKLDGELKKFCSPKDQGNPDWMIGGIEGPFVLKRGGTYFMFFSAWTRGYEIGVMRAPTPLGPWTLVDREPIFGTRKRQYREKQMQEGGYAHLKFEDTADPFVEVGHNAVFEGPDGKDWLCCHYFLEGKQPIPGSPIPEYRDTAPQLGIEPLRFSNGKFSVTGPTWTEQVVKW